MIRNYWQHLYEQYEKMLAQQKQVIIEATVTRNGVTQKWFIWHLDPYLEQIELAPITAVFTGHLPNDMFPDRQVYTANEMSTDTHLDVIGMLEQEETWQDVRFVKACEEKDFDCLMIVTKIDYVQDSDNVYKQLPQYASFERVQ